MGSAINQSVVVDDFGVLVELACNRLREFDALHGLLAHLLGYKDYQDMMTHFSKEDERIIHMLLGPHGKTIYKALLARRG